MRSKPEDLTTRARIRDAAIAAIARDGFDRASLRAIARDAQVSAALIVHHFGDKEGLRIACDEHVVETMLGSGDSLASSASPDLLRRAIDEMGQHTDYLDYLARLLGEDSPAGRALFDRLLQATRDTLREQERAGMVRPSADPEASAVLLTLYGLGPVMLRHHYARSFGSDRLTPAILTRSTLPVLDVFTHGMFTDDRMLVAAREAIARGADGDEDLPPPTEAMSSPNPPHSRNTESPIG